jgi:aminoglycoside phosphotransferase (APT) family kinase protein
MTTHRQRENLTDAGPELSVPARTATEQVVAALRAQLTRVNPDRASISALLAKFDGLLSRAQFDDDADQRRAVSSERTAGLAARVARYAGTADTAAERVGAVLAAEAAQDRAAGDLVADLVTCFRALDLDQPTPETDPGTSATGAQNALGTIEASTLDPGRVQDYLTRRLNRPVEVQRVARMAGGYSKETILVVFTDSGEVTELILRKVVPGRPAANLPMEFEAMRFGRRQGLPVPDALWLELDESALGSPFFVATRIHGRNAGDVNGPDATVEPGVAHQLAVIAATLHAGDISTVAETPVVPMASVSDVGIAIAEQHRILAQAAELQSDKYTELWHVVLGWLSAHIPPTLSEPVFVHGDIGFHNLLLDGQQIIGLLDWERSHLGTAAQDLAYLRPSIEGLVPWAEFVHAYVDAGGTAPDPDVIRFYSVWQETWRGIASYRLRSRFMSEWPEPQWSDAAAGLLFTPQYLARALDAAFTAPD